MEKKKPHFHLLVFSQSGRTRLLILLSVLAVFGTWLWFVLSPQSALPPSPLKVVAGGDPSPAGGVFARSGTPALGLGRAGPSEAGAVAFFGVVEGGSSPVGIFQTDGVAMTKVAAVGDPTPLGGTFAFIFAPAQNQVGQVAFLADVVDGQAERGVFLASGGKITTVAALGAASPLGTLSSLSLPALNNAGEVVFAVAAGAESGVRGILRASGGTVEKVLAEGEATPLTGMLSLDVQLSSQVAVNDAGVVAFRASVTEGGVTRQAIFASPRAGGVVKVVAEGDASPLGGAFA